MPKIHPIHIKQVRYLIDGWLLIGLLLAVSGLPIGQAATSGRTLTGSG